MADVLLREPSLRVQGNADISPQTVIPYSYLANDSSLPLETTVHPVALAIPLGTFGWFILATWIGFVGDQTSLVLAAVTFLGIMYFSLLVGLGTSASGTRVRRIGGRSFTDFLDGDVEILTGRITGREALEQLATLPITLAVGGSAIIAAAVSARYSTPWPH